jgi:hypothetical protein
MSKLWLAFSTRILDLRAMGFTSLPAEVWKFTFVTVIRMADNRLHLLPVCLSRLTKLRELDIQRNCIRAIPACLISMTQLTRLDWNGNPIYFPPIAVMYKGLPFVKMWMQRLVSSSASGLGGQPGSGVLMFEGLRLRHVMLESFSRPGCPPSQERLSFACFPALMPFV